jgi:hypothetical protein
MPDQVTNGREAVEQRRRRLRRLMDRLEAALAEPPGAGIDVWCARLSDLAGELDTEWRGHVEGTEGPGGLFEEVVAAAPRLASHVERVRDEHPPLRQQLDRFVATVDGRDVDAIRAAGLELLTALVVHRQHGADLLYEAYWVDVGGLSG